MAEKINKIPEDYSKLDIRQLMEKMAKSQEELIAQKKMKGFKLPFAARISNQKLKRNYITVQYIQDNKEVKFIKAPIDESTITINEIPYLAQSEHIMTHKGKPFITVVAGDTEPLSIPQRLDDASDKKRLTVGYRLLLNKLKTNMLKQKTEINWPLIIGGIFVVIIIGYFLSSGNFKLF